MDYLTDNLTIQYFVIMIILTAFVYLFIPLTIVLTGKKFKLSTLRMIAISSGFIGKLIFFVLSSGYADSNVTAAFLWSFVGYQIMKKKSYIGDKDITFTTDLSTDDCSIPSDIQNKPRKKYCKYCGSIIDETSRKCTGCGKQYFKKIHFKISYIIITLLFVLVCVLWFNNYSLSKENHTLSKTNEELKNKNRAFSSIKYNIYPIYTPHADGTLGYSSVKNSPMEIKSVSKDIVFVSTASNEKNYVTLEQFKNGDLMVGAKFTYKAYYIDDAIKKGYTAVEIP